MLDNLYKLGSELMKNGRMLSVFCITYNSVECYVVFHRLEKAKGYYTIKLEFIRIDDHESLVCYANKSHTNLDFIDFKNFFRLNTGFGKAEIRDIFKNFYNSFNSQIPTIIETMNREQQNVMRNYIYNNSPASERDKIYLYDFKKTRGHRTNFNNDKAAASYPEIYEHFKHDTDHSFFFSPREEDEVNLSQLLQKLANRVE